MLRESLNLWGIILAGGALWIIFLVAAQNFLKTTANYSTQGLIAIIIMTLLCFAPLLVAHDTTRMVGIIWLPTLLLIREIDLKRALDFVRFRQWALGACLVQMLLPPILVYLGGAAPLNCYSRELILRFLPREKDMARIPTRHDGLRPAVGPFGLYALDRRDISNNIVCWPPRPYRAPSIRGAVRLTTEKLFRQPRPPRPASACRAWAADGGNLYPLTIVRCFGRSTAIMSVPRLCREPLTFSSSSPLNA